MSLNISTRGMNLTTTDSTMHVREMDPKVYQRRANFAAFVAILRLITMKRRAKALKRKGFVIGSKAINCHNAKFEWADIDCGDPLTKCASTINDSATTLAVTAGTGAMFTVNDLIYNRNTGETCRVTNVSGDNLTIVRGWGDSTAAAITADDVIILVSNAFSEGSGAPKARAYSPREAYNYCQTFKRTVDASRRSLQTKYYGDINKMDTKKRFEWDQFLLERSRAYYIGERNSITDSDGNPLTTTRGIDRFITQVYNKSSFTYNYFMEFAEMAYGYGGDEKFLVINGALATLIQKEVLANKISIDISPKSKEFGVNIKRLSTVHGDMDFMIDMTMNQIYPNPTGFALELELIEEMVMEPDRWHENVQLKDVDGRKDLILGDAGLKLISPERHAKIVIA